jgi:hypothetical protein
MSTESQSDDIEFLSQPLTTEDGFLNPACRNELEAVVAGMGKTHQRLADDPEWSEKKDRWTFRTEIVGQFAMWACRQSPYGVPDGLENVCKYLHAALKSCTDWGTHGMAECSLCEINRWLYEILDDQGVAEFDAWNRCKKGETPTLAFASAMDGPRDPDYDFIDLDALLHNVCIGIRDERRDKKRFDDDFDARRNLQPS